MNKSDPPPLIPPPSPSPPPARRKSVALNYTDDISIGNPTVASRKSARNIPPAPTPGKARTTTHSSSLTLSASASQQPQHGPVQQQQQQHPFFKTRSASSTSHNVTASCTLTHSLLTRGDPSPSVPPPPTPLDELGTPIPSKPRRTFLSSTTNITFPPPGLTAAPTLPAGRTPTQTTTGLTESALSPLERASLVAPVPPPPRIQTRQDVLTTTTCQRDNTTPVPMVSALRSHRTR